MKVFNSMFGMGVSIDTETLSGEGWLSGGLQGEPGTGTLTPIGVTTSTRNRVKVGDSSFFAQSFLLNLSLTTTKTKMSGADRRSKDFWDSRRYTKVSRKSDIPFSYEWTVDPVVPSVVQAERFQPRLDLFIQVQKVVVEDIRSLCLCNSSFSSLVTM